MSLMRNEYHSLTTGAVRTGGTTRGESLTDIELYVMPVDAARTAALHQRGVADGMAVSATGGQPGLQVATGAALDGLGRVLLLVAQGVAVTDPTVDPDAVQGVPTVPVDADGVPMDTSTTDPAGVAGDYYLTLSYHEAASTGTAANGPVRLHSPWLRLMPTTGFSDDGEQVVLAAVTLAADGSVTALAAGPRRVSGVHAGVVELRVPRAGPGPGLGIEQVGVAELRPRQNGDLDLTLTPTGGPAVTAVAVDGATGTVRLASDLELQGPAAGGHTYALRSGADGSWRLADATASADRLAVDAAGRVTIGTGAGERILHVEGSEVHSGGWQGGFSFADRRVHRFVDAPAAGERWVWYADGGTARLWSGSDRLTVGAGGLDVAGMFFISGREAMRATDSWLRLNQSMSSPSGVHTPGLFAPGSLNVGGLDGWADPGGGNLWVSGQARIEGGALFSGVVAGRSSGEVTYPFSYETVGVATPTFNLRLQSPNAVIVHAGGAERLSVTAAGTDLAGRLSRSGREMLRGEDSWLRLNQAGHFNNGVHTPGLLTSSSLNIGGYASWGDPGGGNAVIAGSLVVHGFVQLGYDDADVVIGGNQTGPFMQIHDDLWFSDPQDGTIELKDASRVRPGKMRGIWLAASSRADKSDVAPLGPTDLEGLLAEALATEVVHYRWRGEDSARRPRLGVIAEQVPACIAGDERRSVSLAEYATMILGALQVLAGRVTALEHDVTPVHRH